MCQIQFIKRKGKCLAHKDISEFFKLMELGSVDNNCAFGFFNDKVFHKSKGRFNLSNFQKNKKLLESNFIVGHNRLATSGDKNKNFNNHPFKLGDFILVHNGVIHNSESLRCNHNIISQVETDSFVILWLINHFVTNSKIKDRVKSIISAIQKTTKKLRGQFSVFLYDKANNDLYYFKNELAEFSFCLFDNSLLVGTTNFNNLAHLFLNDKYVFDDTLFKKRTLIEVENNKIYLINDSDFIKEIANFETSADNYAWCDFNYRTGGYDFNEDDEFSYYDELTIDQQIQETFDQLLGYVPEYKFISSAGMVRIKYDKHIYQDLRNYLSGMVIQEGYIFFDADALIGDWGCFR